MFFKRKRVETKNISTDELALMAVGFLENDVIELEDERTRTVDLIHMMLRDLEDISTEMQEKAVACADLRSRLLDLADSATKQSEAIAEVVSKIQEVI